MTQLKDPPRRIGMMLKGSVLFGGVLNYVGWAMMIFGLIFTGVFIFQSEVITAVKFSGALEHAPGEVIFVNQTGSRVNDEFVYQIGYQFLAGDGVQFKGHSYETDTDLKPKQIVTVEYRSDRPDISRIKGLRAAMFPWPVVFVGVLPLIALLLIFLGFRGGLKRLRLLVRGIKARGTYIKREETLSRVNKQIVYRYFFSFKDGDEGEHTITGNTHRVDWFHENRSGTDILYDQRRPDQAVILSLLPGKLEVDQKGVPVGRSIGWIFMPAICGVIIFILTRVY